MGPSQPVGRALDLTLGVGLVWGSLLLAAPTSGSSPSLTRGGCLCSSQWGVSRRYESWGRLLTVIAVLDTSVAWVMTLALDGLVTKVLFVIYLGERVDGKLRSLDASAALVLACLIRTSLASLAAPSLVRFSCVLAYLELFPDPFLLRTRRQRFYWRRLFSLGFTHVTTRFLQEQGLGGTLKGYN